MAGYGAKTPGKGSTSGPSGMTAGRGGMPKTTVQGGATTGTTHGKHDVAHPVQGASGSQTIHKHANGTS